MIQLDTIEKIPNKCKDDLKLPDVRLLRPRTLIIHDNLKKENFLYYKYFAMMKKLQIITKINI